MLTAKEIKSAVSGGPITLKIKRVNGKGGMNVMTREGKVACQPGDIVTVDKSVAKSFLLRGDYADPYRGEDIPRKKRSSAA